MTMVILQKCRWRLGQLHRLMGSNVSIAFLRFDNIVRDSAVRACDTSTSTSTNDIRPNSVQPQSCFAGGRQIGSSVLNYNKNNEIWGIGWCKQMSCHIVNNTVLQARNLSNGAHHHHRRNRDPDMRNCKSLEELTQMAFDNINIMSPRGMSAYWTLVLRHLPRRSRPAENKQMQIQIDELIDKSLRSIERYGYRDLAQTAISLSKIIVKVSKSGKRKGTPQQILQDVLIGPNSSNKQFIFKYMADASVPILYKFDARSLSNLIYAFGLAKVIVPVKDGTAYFDMLAEVAIPNLNRFEPQGLSNMLWAYANVGISHSKLFAKAGETIIAMEYLDEFWPQHLSNIVWAYATLNGKNPELFKKVADHIVKLDDLNKFYPQAISNIVWAYATAELSHPKLFEKVGNHIVTLDHLNSFKPQNLSNIVWAYATAEEKNPKLFKKVADHIVALDNLDRFKPQELFNTVWAYATAEEPHPMLFQKVADHIVKLEYLDKFKPQDFSNTLWAYAKAEESHPKLFKKVADHIVSLDLRQFNPQNFSIMLWAYATAGVSHPKMYEKVADHIVSLNDLDRSKLQAISNTVWAYATAEESHPKLFQKLAGTAIKRQTEFIPQEIVNFLWASATNGEIDQNLFVSLTPSVKANLDKYNEQGLANIAWAYAVANVAAPSVFDDKFLDVCIKKEDEFIVDELNQLYQWQLWQEELMSDIKLPQSLQKKCNDAFISRVPEPSKLQDDVTSELTSIGLQLDEEVLTKSGYRLDAVVEVNGKHVGVEVDGPSHFIGRTRTPTGSTILKHRQVTNLDDISLVSVPYWEWNKLKKDSEKKQQYLRKLLGLD